MQALAARLGAAHPGFEMSARDVADAALRASGLPGWDTLLDSGGLDCVDRGGGASFTGGFGFPDGKFRFSPDWSALGPRGAGMPKWPDHWDVIENADDDHPLRLVTAPAHSFLNTSFTETPTSVARCVRPSVLATAADLARRGIADGTLVKLFNARGAVFAHVRAADGQPNGVLVLEGLWPNAAFVGGIGVNALVGAEPGGPNGGAVFHDVAVGMEAAE